MFSGVTLLILAGGKSKRMGSPKHLLPASGGTMIDHIVNRLGDSFSEVLVAGRGLKLDRADARAIEDVNLKRTPLVGILSGLIESKNPNVFVIGCDMPFVKPELIQCLMVHCRSATDVVIPVIRGYYEPLCAVYSVNNADSIRQYLDSGCSKVTGFYKSVQVTEVLESDIRKVDPALESFINLNTPHDYLSYYLS